MMARRASGRWRSRPGCLRRPPAAQTVAKGEGCTAAAPRQEAEKSHARPPNPMTARASNNVSRSLWPTAAGGDRRRLPPAASAAGVHQAAQRRRGRCPCRCEAREQARRPGASVLPLTADAAACLFGAAAGSDQVDEEQRLSHTRARTECRARREDRAEACPAGWRSPAGVIPATASSRPTRHVAARTTFRRKLMGPRRQDDSVQAERPGHRRVWGTRHRWRAA